MLAALGHSDVFSVIFQRPYSEGQVKTGDSIHNRLEVTQDLGLYKLVFSPQKKHDFMMNH